MRDTPRAGQARGYSTLSSPARRWRPRSLSTGGPDNGKRIRPSPASHRNTSCTGSSSSRYGALKPPSQPDAPRTTRPAATARSNAISPRWASISLSLRTLPRRLETHVRSTYTAARSSAPDTRYAAQRGWPKPARSPSSGQLSRAGAATAVPGPSTHNGCPKDSRPGIRRARSRIPWCSPFGYPRQALAATDTRRRPRK